MALIRFRIISYMYGLFLSFASHVESGLYTIFFNSKNVNNEMILKRPWIKYLSLLNLPELTVVVLTLINLCRFDLN